MRTYIISTAYQRTRPPRQQVPFRMKARDADEAFAKIEKHMGRTAGELGLQLDRTED